jgi:hypothetical protein
MEKVASKAEVSADNLIIDEFLNFKIFMEMKSKLLITGLAFLALTTLANAQNKTTGQGQQTTPPITRGTYVDANNDGICDNFETTASYNRNGRRMANASATGNRRGMAAGQGRGIARPEFDS